MEYAMRLDAVHVHGQFGAGHGRVDMLMVDKTLQYLIGAGMDIGLENNPYLGFVYTSFQERATWLSHGNMARLATEGGDPMLARTIKGTPITNKIICW
ncbi:hypothetical protein MTR67_027685 [Solanum verrucosum]|uniref:Uncharacterized protein n=1 Tax=Solanum verrucosum TaxID=315347 RepID=A0AAF0TZP0_SOLVR|nr:hypothetical protein MTR67_027685 [Solanum verrucosum]